MLYHHNVLGLFKTKILLQINNKAMFQKIKIFSFIIYKWQIIVLFKGHTFPLDEKVEIWN